MAGFSSQALQDAAGYCRRVENSTGGGEVQLGQPWETKGERGRGRHDGTGPCSGKSLVQKLEILLGNLLVLVLYYRIK